MERIVVSLFLGVFINVLKYGVCCEYGNATLQPALRQLCEFKMAHPRPIGVLTTIAGRPVDLREIITVNSDLMNNEHFFDTIMHFAHERIPERHVHPKGTAAFGYFEVTHDVSQYTKAEVFNGIGKKTPLVGRFSTDTQFRGGPDVGREFKGLAFKFYTKEGNLDMLCLQTPVYFYRDPLYFNTQLHALRRNPRTAVFDRTATWDFVLNRPEVLLAFSYINSDYGVPLSYRHMDVFPIHAYEVINKKGDRYIVRFNFRTDQGIKRLRTSQIPNATLDLDYYTRDLYNAIYKKRYPSWTLEMDVIPFEKLKHLDFNPFDVTGFWKEGSYFTVKVGRVVFDRNPKNHFEVSELSIFNPGSLVPGIPGPVDTLFKGRKLAYRETQNYRVGMNHIYIDVNKPLYAKTYTRDGVPPVNDNMRDAPNYFPNSYNGPEPYVDESLSSKKLMVFETPAVDLQRVNYLYNRVLTSDGQRQRLADAFGDSLATTTHETLVRALKLLTLVDKDLGRRVRARVKFTVANNNAMQAREEKEKY